MAEIIALFASLDIVVNIVLLVFLSITAIAIVSSRNLLIATILLGVFSLLMAASYLALSAPDVAITEAAVGAGISTILLLLAIALTGRNEKRPEDRKSQYKSKLFPFFPFITVVLFGATLIYASLDMPHFGDENAPIHKHTAPYYLTESYKDMGIPNVVTSVLSSYRGFDTLGETFVVFTAAMSVLLLLSERFKRRKKSK